jgi:hypothetical protein
VLHHRGAPSTHERPLPHSMEASAVVVFEVGVGIEVGVGVVIGVEVVLAFEVEI